MCVMNIMESETITEFHSNHFVENLEVLKKRFPCRDQEICDILNLLGETPKEETPPLAFIHGDTATGKTSILLNCLKLGKYKYAMVNCLERYSMKVMYENIVNQLAEHEMNAFNSYQPYAKCTNFADFVHALQKLSDEKNTGKEDDSSMIIVFDKAEKLKQLEKHILVKFLSLRELTGLKVCVVLVSTLQWINFYVSKVTVEPIDIYLLNYTQKQLLEILQLNKPEQFSSKFYENYISLFLSIFYPVCNDLRELKYQAKINFDYYSGPIRRGELTEKDTNELWKRSQQFFKKSLQSLYLKVDCSVEVAEKMTSVTTSALSMELPFYSKYLLIGSYIASYNPAAEDKKLFLKNHGKIKRTKRSKVEKVKHHLIGPKPFGLQRLLAIVSSILDDDKFNMNANLFVEVASLVKMNLLIQVSEDILDMPSFKCNVGLQFIDVIAKNVQFPIRNYLVDFMNN